MAETEKKRFDLLRIEPQDKPIYLLVRAFAAADYPVDATEYHYNERACPSDILNVEEIIIDGDMDPHGICEFVRTVEVQMPTGSYNPEELWAAAVPEVFKN